MPAQPAQPRTLATRMAEAGLDPATALGQATTTPIPMAEPEYVPPAEPQRRQAGLPRHAGLPSHAGLPKSPAALQAPGFPTTDPGVTKAVTTLTDEVRQLRTEIDGLKKTMTGVTQLRAELVAQRRNEIDEMSAEISNACCITRAEVLHNTVEYQFDISSEPSARGLPSDNDLLAAGLEDSPSVAVEAGSEVVLVYPMYTRSLEDAGMGDEIYMRRRQIDPMSAEVTHTYIKVMGTYGEQTVQYIGNFAL